MEHISLPINVWSDYPMTVESFHVVEQIFLLYETIFCTVTASYSL